MKKTAIEKALERFEKEPSVLFQTRYPDTLVPKSMAIKGKRYKVVQVYGQTRKKLVCGDEPLIIPTKIPTVFTISDAGKQLLES